MFSGEDNLRTPDPPAEALHADDAGEEDSEDAGESSEDIGSRSQ